MKLLIIILILGAIFDWFPETEETDFEFEYKETKQALSPRKKPLALPPARPPDLPSREGDSY
jgi:hypothetical protein